MGKYGKFRPLVRLAALLLALWPGLASAACRQALAIGLDISGSVDASEYRLQLDGLALALLDRDVQDAFLAMPDALVRLYIYEWGGYGTQRPLVFWTDVTDAAVLNSIANLLLSTQRRPRDPATALGRAMLFGAAALASQRDCWRLTLDLSGDGDSNIGPRPGEEKSAAPLVGVTINALVIGNAAPLTDGRHRGIADLNSYFQSEVIHGAEAFVETANGFEAFQDAMTRKLLRELQTLTIGTLAADAQRR